MAPVMIGVDPHKATHTAVAIDAAETQLGTIRVRACAAQASKLVEWAAGWPDRTWAVESAGGLGHSRTRHHPTPACTTPPPQGAQAPQRTA